jgi:outer membrane receptor for ferric coprogen and ferric-rhodotorulic acid
MDRLRRVILRATPIIVAGILPMTALAEESTDTADSKSIETIVVEGKRASTASATGLNLTPIETPQSVTIVDRQQIEDFNLITANDLLDMVPGVNVGREETDRTDYNSRGFNITSFQVDGTGLPLTWGLQYGDLDTAIFDRVEVIRGADSMLTGVGNPSATINYVRKRPTSTFQASATAEYGSWNDGRFEGDISGPLNEAGSLRGRFVYAYEDRDSYLDYYKVNRNVFYGVVAWDITPNLTMTTGYSIQDNRAKGVLWGALPLSHSDGSAITYPVSASTAAPWTYWNTRDESAFTELAYNFENGWSAKGTFTYKGLTEHAKLLYASGYPDPVTGRGVSGSSGIYPSYYDQYMLDGSATGPVSLFGREHQLVVGFDASRNHGMEYENFSTTYPDYPAVGNWGRITIPEPTYPGAYLATNETDRLYRIYGAAHLNFSDQLKGLVGFNALRLRSTGFSYGVSQARSEDAASPYAGIMYDLTPNVSAYASYTDIFNPQSDVDIHHRPLAAAAGESFEGGFKTQWLDKKLDLTATGFHGEQAGLATYAGDFKNGQSYYTGVETFVTGYEFEVTGRLTDQWSVEGGWTQLWISDKAGQNPTPYYPSQSLKLATTYSVPRLNDLKLGASLRWQDAVHVQDLAYVTQNAYAVFDLMVSVQVVEGLHAALNIDNVTDKKYFNSLAWNQAYYAAPRSVMFSLNYKM